MEYLQEYVLKSNKEKIIISSIFEKYSDEIQKKNIEQFGQ